MSGEAEVAALAAVLRTVQATGAYVGPEAAAELHAAGVRVVGPDSLRDALTLCRDALRERERKAGKVIASDVALFATATLDGLRMEPGLAARIDAALTARLTETARYRPIPAMSLREAVDRNR